MLGIRPECCSEPTEGTAHSPGCMPTWLHRQPGTCIITTISDGLYTTPTLQISLSATYITTEQPLDPTEATRAVPYSRNYNYCDCCSCPASVLTVYKPPTDYCRCDATLQIDREWGLTSSCDTRTDANLRENYLSMPGSDPSHREVGRQAVSCITCPPPATRTPAQR